MSDFFQGGHAAWAVRDALVLVAVVGLLWAWHRLRVRGLAVREQMFRDALETMPAMAFSSRPDGTRTWVNLRWVEYTGQSIERAAGVGWRDAIHADDLDRAIEHWRVALSTGEPLEYEIRLRGATGTYRWFLVRAVPLRDSRGQIVKWHGIATDIEERKRAEDARRRSEAALDQARSELARVASFTSLGVLAASIAHEVNQPLSGVITNASTCLRLLTADDPDIEGARETARRTIRDGNRAADVITRLRALLSRKATFDESVDLSETAREVLALSSSDLQKNQVVIRSELGDRLPPVLADRVQLQQVILNLLINASQAMTEIHDRPRQLVIRTEEDGGRVRLLIKDTGVGIDPRMMPHLFEPFYTTKPNGMGIGLSVCRSIVEGHGGRLSVEPHEGPGATFSVSLPTNTFGQ